MDATDRLAQAETPAAVLEVFYDELFALLGTLHAKVPAMGVMQYSTHIQMARMLDPMIVVSKFTELVYMPVRAQILAGDVEYFRSLELDHQQAETHVAESGMEMDVAGITLLLKALSDEDARDLLAHLADLCRAIDRLVKVNRQRSRNAL